MSKDQEVKEVKESPADNKNPTWADHFVIGALVVFVVWAGGTFATHNGQYQCQKDPSCAYSRHMEQVWLIDEPEIVIAVTTLNQEVLYHPETWDEYNGEPLGGDGSTLKIIKGETVDVLYCYPRAEWAVARITGTRIISLVPKTYLVGNVCD